MARQLVLWATLSMVLFLGGMSPALAQAEPSCGDVVKIKMTGPIGGPQGMGPGQVHPLQVLGKVGTEWFDITGLVRWTEPTQDIVVRIPGGPTGSMLQTGALANLQSGDIRSGRLEATCRNSKGKVLRTQKLVTVSPGAAAPQDVLLVKARPLPDVGSQVAGEAPAPQPKQPAKAKSTGAGGAVALGVLAAGAIAAGAVALGSGIGGSGIGGGGSNTNCPSNPLNSTIDSSCSCSPYCIYRGELISCSAPSGTCKQCVRC